MSNLQYLVDGMSAQWQRERAASQMTLGAMIARLEELPADLEVSGLGGAHSYRGYYSDLAFRPFGDPVSVIQLLAQCKAAMGQVFEGYKGGDYVMGALTPMWVSEYGTTGVKLMAINDDGSLETAQDD